MVFEEYRGLMSHDQRVAFSTGLVQFTRK